MSEIHAELAGLSNSADELTKCIQLAYKEWIDVA
jgi:hypothetical protein